MPVNRNILAEFLTNNGCSNTGRVMEYMEPYFQNAEKGNYPFQKESQLDKSKISSAIISATGRRVEETIFVSLSNPFPKPDWMTGRAYKDSLGSSLESSLRSSLWDSLRDSLGSSLESSLRSSLWDSLRDSLWSSLWDSLRDSLWSSLWDSLGDSIGDSLGDSIGDSIGDSLGDSLWASIFCFLGFSLANKPEQAAKLEGLLEISSACLVLGQKKDQSATWLVLVA